MTEDDRHVAGWEGYRKIGLVENPFHVPADTAPDEVGVKLATRAAAFRLLAAIEQALEGERPRPVRVLKPSSIPDYYPRSAMTTVLRELGAGSETGLLPVYVQLIMMRKGRIRGTLSVLAELVAARSVDLTIAHYARRCLSEPDTQLPEWEQVVMLDVPGLIDRFGAEPEATVGAFFGSPVDLRDEAGAGFAGIMKDSGMRQAQQAADPEEDEETSEDGAAELLAAMVDSDDDSGGELGEVEEEAAAREAAAVVGYVIAHVKKHASPVIARGLRRYVESGTAAMGQELKITRAPRKTLGAIARFARLTFRSLAVIYDGFEAWDDIPDELRATIVSGLSEVRLALGGNGVIVIAGPDREAPEIDDQFATAIRVDLAMPELEQVQVSDALYDSEVFAAWLESAALAGADISALRERVERACAGCADLASGAALAAEEVERAALEASG